MGLILVLPCRVAVRIKWKAFGTMLSIVRRKNRSWPNSRGTGQHIIGEPALYFVSFIWRLSAENTGILHVWFLTVRLSPAVRFWGEGSTFVLLLNYHTGIWLSLMADGLSKKRHLCFLGKEGQQSLSWHHVAAIEMLLPCGLDHLFCCMVLLNKSNRPWWFYLAEFFL